MKYLYFLMMTTLGIFQGIPIISGEINVNEQINKLETYIQKMKPPPELIGNVLQQIQEHCKGNRKFDEAALNNASRCVEKHFNETQLIKDIKKAVPEGQLDDVFHDTCLKWPKVKACFLDVFESIDECWASGKKVNKVVDESIKFFCGNDNDGARIALFVAEGGMECLEQHGDHVKNCIEAKHDIPDVNLDDGIPNLTSKVPNKDDVCGALNSMLECTSNELRRCKDPTPENLASSMIRYVGKAVDCQMKETPQIKSVTRGSVSASSNNYVQTNSLEWLVVLVAGMAFMVV